MKRWRGAQILVFAAALAASSGALGLTSEAEGRWQQLEDGKWSYVQEDGSVAKSQWLRYREEWYYMEEDGHMAVSRLIPYKNDIYYVDEEGKMVSNQWAAVENDESTGADIKWEGTVGPDGQPERWWYYFQPNGKAMKGPDSGKTVPKTIGDRKYAFDSQGRMLSGWIREDDASLMTDEEAWREGDYYFGGADDGAMTLGWMQIGIVDSRADEENQYWINPAFTEEEEQLRYFYFKPNGKKVKGTEVNGDYVRTRQKTINGQVYGFDEYGRMLGEWSQDQNAVVRDGGAGGRRYVATRSQAWRNYHTVEDGRRYTNGWFKVVPAEHLNPDDYEEDEEGWYYADGKGHICAGEFKYIDGKRYGFDTEGRMLHGFQMVRAEGTRILDSIESDEMWNMEFYDEETFDSNALMYGGSGYGLYYFGDEADGSMRTGAQTLKVDADGHQFSRFRFKESGRNKGSGITGIKDSHMYNMGKLLQADPYQKYQVAAFVNQEDLMINADWRNNSSRPFMQYPKGYIRFDHAQDFTGGFSRGYVMHVSKRDDGITVVSRYGERYMAIGLSKEELDQPDSTRLQWDGDDTGITIGEIKKALGIQSGRDQYNEVVIFITGKYGASGSSIQEYVLGLPSDMFYVIDRNGKVIDKNSRVKDGDGVYYKLHRGRLTGTYIEE